MPADAGSLSKKSDASGFLRSAISRLASAPGEIGRAAAWLFDVLVNANAIYSLKTFAAGILAVYVALKLNLSQPGWAMMTVYIVSQPLSGMVLNKSLARAGGTIIGAVMAVVLVATLGGVRELFIPAIALWIGGCLYVSVLLRDSPASYGAMLAGYTAAMVGVPSVTAPETAFNTGVDRCLAILLGITAATLVSRLVFPRSSVRVFRMRVAATLEDMRRSITNTLHEHYDDAQGLAALRNLITDSVALESLRVHASRDTDAARLDGDVVRALQGRLLSVSSLLVSIHDRIALLRRERPAAAAALNPLFARVSERVDFIASGKRVSAPASARDASASARAGYASLTGELLAKLPDFEALRGDPALVVEYNIVLRLLDLLAQWQEINRLRAFLFSDEPGKSAAAANIPAPPPEDTRVVRYRDHSLALVAAFGAFCAVTLCSVAWVATAWAYGASGVVFAAVASCIMAVQDNPARGALMFLYSSVGSLIIAAVVLFYVFQAAPHFPGLVFGAALFAIPLGMLAPTPRYGPLVGTLLLNAVAFLSLKNTPPADFADFLNTNLSLLAGVGFAIACFRLFRPVGADWPVRRLTSGMFRDIAQLSASGDPELQAHFESRMLDRISAITLRLRMDRAGDRAHFQGSLTVLRVGLNNLFLLRTLPSMPQPMAAATRAALDAVAEHFAQLARSPQPGPGSSPQPALDAAIAKVLELGSASHGEALNVLVALRALRTTLAQHARFYGLT